MMSRSLVLITVDCLRADHTGFLRYQRPTTPFLDSLAADGVVFTNAIVGGAPTYYSFPTILASRPPLALGRDVLGIAPGEPTLATVLREAGYRTAAFLAGNPYLSPQFGYSAGFEAFWDCLDAVVPLEPNGGTGRLRGRLNQGLARACHRLGPVGSLYDELYFQYCQRIAAGPAASLDTLRRFPSAETMVDRACTWLSDSGDQPFFLWLHLMDPHAPYYPPEKALRMMGGAQPDAARARYLNSSWNRGELRAKRYQGYRDEVMALYDAGIRWADEHIGRLVEMLRRSRRGDGYVFALTADHGEELLDHGGRFHPPSKLSEELVRVPLLLQVPGLRPMQARDPFSLIHLAPTLLDAVKIPAPAEFRGRSYFSKLERGESWFGEAVVETVGECRNPFHRTGRAGARMLAVREARYKLVLDFHAPSEQLFDLERDPGELHPLPAGSEKPVRRRLLERARQHLAECIEERDPERLRAQLRDLQLEWARSEATVST